MPWGASKEKKEEKEPEVTEEEVLAFMINESTNDTLESTRYISPVYLIYTASIMLIKGVKGVTTTLSTV